MWSLRRPPERGPILSEELRQLLIEEVDDPKHPGVKTTRYDLRKCSHCGGLHAHACPRVKSLRFRPTPGGGQALVQVEFWPAGEWSRDGILWPWDVFGGGDEPIAAVSSREESTTEEEEQLHGSQ